MTLRLKPSPQRRMTSQTVAPILITMPSRAMPSYDQSQIKRAVSPVTNSWRIVHVHLETEAKIPFELWPVLAEPAMAGPVDIDHGAVWIKERERRFDIERVWASLHDREELSPI